MQNKTFHEVQKKAEREREREKESSFYLEPKPLVPMVAEVSHILLLLKKSFLSFFSYTTFFSNSLTSDTQNYVCTLYLVYLMPLRSWGTSVLVFSLKPQDKLLAEKLGKACEGLLGSCYSCGAEKISPKNLPLYRREIKLSP